MIQIAYVNVFVTDLERAIGFYRDELGLSLAHSDAEHARLEARGVAFSMPPTRQPWGGFMALIEDPDCNVFYLDEVSAVHG
jgi:predicted enzyme related to lactoylglutathione lyase